MSKQRKRRPLLTDQLRAAIRASGYSQLALARQVGIEQSAISRFLSGERQLSATAMDRLGAFLDLEIITHGPRAPKPKSK